LHHYALAKCCAKSSDFSLSLLAQGPAVCGVARITGDASFGFLLFLIGFHAGGKGRLE
jgi:hypothetical protein